MVNLCRGKTCLHMCACWVLVSYSCSTCLLPSPPGSESYLPQTSGNSEQRCSLFVGGEAFPQCGDFSSGLKLKKKKMVVGRGWERGWKDRDTKEEKPHTKSGKSLEAATLRGIYNPADGYLATHPKDPGRLISFDNWCLHLIFPTDL